MAITTPIEPSAASKTPSSESKTSNSAEKMEPKITLEESLEQRKKNAVVLAGKYTAGKRRVENFLCDHLCSIVHHIFVSFVFLVCFEEFLGPHFLFCNRDGIGGFLFRRGSLVVRHLGHSEHSFCWSDIHPFFPRTPPRTFCHHPP